MADPGHLDDEAVVQDLMNNPVDADADLVGVCLADHGDAAWRTGFVGQQVDGCSDPLLVTPLQAGE